MSRRPRRLGLRREVLILIPVSMILLVVLSLVVLLSYRNAVELALAVVAERAEAQRAQSAEADLVDRLDALAEERRTVDRLTVLVIAVDGALVLLVLLFLPHMLAPYERLLERARAVGVDAERDDDEVEFLLATFERALSALSGRGDEIGEADDDEIGPLTRTLPSSFESGVLLVDRDGRTLATNALARKLLELGPDPASGTPTAELLVRHPELARLVAGAVTEEIDVHRREVEVSTGTGRSTLGLTVHPLRREGSPPRAFLVLFTDLTEIRRRAEQARLAENLRHVGELAGGVAHELRNSLATIRGYLSLAERAVPEGAAGDPASLAEIRRESDHLQRVLEDFLSFARPGSVRLERVDLGRLATRAAADPALGEAAVEVRLDEERPHHLDGDPQLLERAVRNLLHNAVQASPPGEPVTVEVVEDDGHLVLRVCDRGRGVPEEIRESLFDPFVSGRADGVGLGLALARRIVLLHGGELDLAGRPGGGTVARMRLPAGENVTKGNDSTP